MASREGNHQNDGTGAFDNNTSLIDASLMDNSPEYVEIDMVDNNFGIDTSNLPRPNKIKYKLVNDSPHLLGRCGIIMHMGYTERRHLADCIAAKQDAGKVMNWYKREGYFRGVTLNEKGVVIVDSWDDCDVGKFITQVEFKELGDKPKDDFVTVWVEGPVRPT
ncbi:hypothetical protein EJ08DRAFT_694078 [Tothia fuscella]|uniref:Uncharacterized protein n=1 Tax=Tothia fuscella TaxID=1048955 RepID=A0A9P4NYK6_9PEZI|nr:hypothetical protein EJ08DRAFT_694078 [Tothia fuscella]